MSNPKIYNKIYLPSVKEAKPNGNIRIKMKTNVVNM